MIFFITFNRALAISLQTFFFFFLFMPGPQANYMCAQLIGITWLIMETCSFAVLLSVSTSTDLFFAMKAHLMIIHLTCCASQLGALFSLEFLNSLKLWPNTLGKSPTQTCCWVQLHSTEYTHRAVLPPTICPQILFHLANLSLCPVLSV